ncbi:MAG: hypothetical protein FWE80_06150 [Oscillospiraceae bacterium]|nr:hypothetical protein [Oscillospiraceae bacterium]
MRKASKLLAVFLAVTLVFSLATIFASAGAGKQPNPAYKRPQKGIPQFTAGMKTPIMDGAFSLAEWGTNTKLFSFNMAMVNAGEGFIWLNLSKNLEDPQNPVPINGDFHMAWDKDTIYMALVMKGVGHFQQQGNPEYLWKEDCLQIQIGADNNGQAERYEFGFAYSVGFGKPLGFRWYPLQSAIQAPDKESDRMFYTSRNNNTQETVYEMRLKRTVFGRRTDFAAGNVIPFAAALHVYDPNDWYNPEVDDGPGAGPRGCFYEWAEGVVGGNEEKVLDTAAWITLLATPVIPGGIIDPTTTTTTATTTTRTTTTTSGGVTTTTTVNGTGGGSTTPTKSGGTPTNTTRSSTTRGTTTTTRLTTTRIVTDVHGSTKIITEAPTKATTSTTVATTTTVAAVEREDTIIVEATASEDVEGDDLENVRALFNNVNARVKKFEAKVEAETKYIQVTFADNTMKVYYKDTESTFAELVATQIEGEFGLMVDVFEVPEGAEIDAIYVAMEPLPTEPTEITTEANDDNTTKADDADAAATTTKAGGSSNNGSSGGGFPWWIIIVVVVVAGAGAGVFFFLKKRKEDGGEEE